MTHSNFNREPRNQLGWKLARLAIFSLCAGGLVSAVLYRGSLAQAEGTSRSELGVDTSGLGEVMLNGQRFMTLTGKSARGLTETLSSFEARCRPGTGGIIDWSATLDRSGPVEPLEGDRRYPGARAEDEEHGFVSCLYLGRDWPFDEPSLGAISEFESRYLYARAAGTGTSFVVAWNPEPLDLGQLVPEDGDVAGADVSGIPRPESSTRILSGRESSHPERITAYRTHEPAAELKKRYAERLESDWQIFDTGKDTLAARRGNRLVWLIFTETNGSTVMTIADDPGIDPSLELSRALKR